MIRFRTVLSLVTLCALFASACGSPAPGPTTWLDRPLDNSRAPLEPMIIMAHASDEEGIVSFEFTVDGKTVASASALGRRLESMSYEWNPSAPGVYLVGARAVNSNGDIGPAATSRVSISTASSSAADSTPQPVAPAGTRAPTSTPRATVSATPMPPSAPPPTETATRRPPTATSTIQPTVPSATPIDIATPIPIDTTPPGIFGAVINPDRIYTAGPGCPTKTAESNVVATDPSGIARIYATWSIYADGVVVESGTVEYIFVNPQYSAWNGVFGPVNNEGTMMIQGTVLDNEGNAASFSFSIEVVDCIL